MRTWGLVSLMCLAMFTGCGGGGTAQSKVGPLAGNWQITMQNATSSETQGGFLLQSGSNLTGGLELSGQTVSGQLECTGVGSVQGHSTGPDVTLTVTQAGRTVNLTGAAASDFGSIFGNYSILAAGCGQTDVGTWSAKQVKPLTGNIKLTFSSLVSSVVYHFTGTITQGPNVGQSTATLSGTIKSTDAPCPASASIAGVISGTSVVFNFLASGDVPLGKYAGTMTTDATSITGGYRFSNASTGGCSDAGTATVAVQASTGT